jgi:hypothetical protein
MGKRSGVPDTEEAVSKLTLEEPKAEIQRFLKGFEQGGTSQGRKSFFKRSFGSRRQGRIYMEYPQHVAIGEVGHPHPEIEDTRPLASLAIGLVAR